MLLFRIIQDLLYVVEVGISAGKRASPLPQGIHVYHIKKDELMGTKTNSA